MTSFLDHHSDVASDLPVLFCWKYDYPLGSEVLLGSIRNSAGNACKAQYRQFTPLIEERALVELQSPAVLKKLGIEMGAWEFFEKNALEGINNEDVSTEVAIKCFLGSMARTLGRGAVDEVLTVLLDEEAYHWLLDEGDRLSAAILNSAPSTPVKRAARVMENIWLSPAMTAQVPADVPSLLSTSESYENFLNMPLDSPIQVQCQVFG